MLPLSIMQRMFLRMFIRTENSCQQECRLRIRL
ncbi:hypothetical protein C802_02933 [Phocaeicola sartorii]|uniref:Uncharacterized protein n=1 Tax=Phocaeicola sartorii TaxID=671267 RepID=R9I538_9BACT|nr:hypothetical protein C802_02933 [Phocaeicola sartorii]